MRFFGVVMRGFLDEDELCFDQGRGIKLWMRLGKRERERETDRQTDRLDLRLFFQ